jgi:hypothetical protein
MFIVATTLGLLAVMGIYGLTATSSDIRSAGHMREALQGQRAGEAVLMMTAETFNPTVAQALVNQMTDQRGQARDCKTANPYTGNVATRFAEGCIRLDPSRMTTIANTSNALDPWAVSTLPAQPGFTQQSFGSVVNQPFFNIEVTNLINTEVTAGNSQTVRYSQVTVTVFVQLKQSAGVAAETQVTGRSRLTVGPSVSGGAAPAIF